MTFEINDDREISKAANGKFADIHKVKRSRYRPRVAQSVPGS